MGISRLQHSEIRLMDFENGIVTVEPAHDRRVVQLQVPGTPGPRVSKFSPEEAYAIGAALMEQAKECGYDSDTGETRRIIS